MNVLNNRREDFGQVLKDYCVQRRDLEFFNELISWRKSKQQFIKQELKPFIIPYRNSKYITISNYVKDLDRKVETLDFHFLKSIYKTNSEPFGKQTFPDHIIYHPRLGEIYIDTKCVICKNGKPQYGSTLGNVFRLVKDFRQGNWNINPYVNAIISIVYYDEITGEILDSLFMPMTYYIRLNNDKTAFSTNGGAGISGSVCGGLPLLSDNRKFLSFNEKDDIIKNIAYSNIYNENERFYK